MTSNGEGSDSDRVKRRTPKVTLYVLGALTVIYVVSLALIISRIAPCDDFLPEENWLLRQIDRYLQCRDINELGDALAGAFAPLAFLWLAGAVFIQSRELAAQRQELQLAHEEARQTRDVMKQQAAESRAATTFIGKQTDIMEKRHQAETALIHARAFEDTFNNFCRHVTAEGDLKISGTLCRAGGKRDHTWTHNLLEARFPEEFSLRATEMAMNAIRADKALSNVPENIKIAVDDNSVERLRFAVAGLEILVKQQKKLSHIHSTALVLLPLENVLSNWRNTLEQIDNSPRSSSFE